MIEKSHENQHLLAPWTASTTCSAFLLDEVLNHQDPREFEKDMAKLEKVTLKDLVAVSQKVFSDATISC